MNPSRSLPLLLATAALLVASACGEKSPPEAPAAPDAPAEAPATPEAASDPKGAAPAAPGAPAPATAAPSPADPATEAARAAADAADAIREAAGDRLRPISLPAFPEQVTAVAATPSLTALLEAIGRVGRDVGAGLVPADPVAAALEVIRMQLKIEDVKWLDPARPVRLAIPDPSVYPDGFVAVVPITGGADAVRAAFGDRLVAVDGHAGRVDFGARPVFVDFIGDHLVASTHPPLFEALRGFLDDTLLAWTPTDLLAVEVSVTHIKRAFAAELGMMRDLASAFGGEMARRAAVPMQAATLKGLIDGAFDFVDHTDRVGFSFAATGSRVRLAFGLRGVDGSALSATLGRLSDVRLGHLEAASPETWFGLATHLPRELLEVDRDALIASLTAGAGLSPEAAARAADFIVTLTAESTGDSTTSFETDGAFGFAFNSLSGARDASAAREALLGLLGVFFERGLGQARAELGAAADAVPSSSFKELVELANTVGGPMGARFEVVDGPRDGVHVSAFVLHVDWEKGLERANPEVFALMRAVLGDRVGFAAASGDGRLALTVGPNAVTRAADLAAGRLRGGEPNLSRAGDGAFAAATLRLGPMLTALSAFPQLARNKEAFAQLPKDEAFSLAGRVDTRDLVVTLTVPVPLLLALFQ